MVHAPQIRQGSTQFQVGSGLGQSKSSPSLAGGSKGDSTGGLKRINQNNDQQLQLAKGNSNNNQVHQHHPAMVGSQSSIF